MRISNANIAFNAAKAHLDLSKPANQAFIGPTAGTLEMLEASFLLEFFKQLPPEKRTAILERCRALDEQLRISESDFIRTAPGEDRKQLSP